ncbi:hypothetical protein L1280_000867 [Deinococcus sp. HSC-46F16]|uniref:hypothetical protein n=1 Tax=Deinococcus sp. HSC-46F16 TaxID=2910968 RepID=UPI0020A21184|nr:hypothetical protein [Deinococcus sp. HSC-46F16]MCP2013739.1 hypothetical protein [Deinococcus sp. HSC-46F16]
MLEAFAWIVHPLAALTLAHWAFVIFSGRGKHAAEVGRAAAGIALMAVLGADWIVHPAAGMLLGYLGSRGFHRWQRDWRALLVGVLAGLIFMALGADWLVFPLTVMGLIWVFSAPASLWTAGKSPQVIGDARASAALPEQAGGLPLGDLTSREREAMPVGGAVASANAARRAQEPPVPDDGDALTALTRDERLPGEARAQLIALDLRTREALRHLDAQGQGASEGAYLARAVRREYAPAAAQAYLKLPPTLANTQPLEDSKTGRDLLREQLDLLLEAVAEVLDGALRSGGQELLTHGRFLREKFRKEPGDLEL